MTTPRETELHEHYARNARACGHAATCRKVTDTRNWPTIMGRSPCTCGRGEPARRGTKRATAAVLAGLLAAAWVIPAASAATTRSVAGLEGPAGQVGPLGGHVSGTSAVFTVPTVTCPTSDDTAMPIYVGENTGPHGTYPAQVGILAVCHAGAASYAGFHRLGHNDLPLGPIYTVAPGDCVEATATYTVDNSSAALGETVYTRGLAGGQCTGQGIWSRSWSAEVGPQRDATSEAGIGWAGTNPPGSFPTFTTIGFFTHFPHDTASTVGPLVDAAGNTLATVGPVTGGAFTETWASNG